MQSEGTLSLGTHSVGMMGSCSVLNEVTKKVQGRAKWLIFTVCASLTKGYNDIAKGEIFGSCWMQRGVHTSVGLVSTMLNTSPARVD